MKTMSTKFTIAKYVFEKNRPCVYGLCLKMGS
jgi:hypothetical protein